MARLASGIRVRSDGKLEKRFTYDGKRYSVYGMTAKEVSEKEFELRKRLESGIYKDNHNITLDEYFKEWIDSKEGKTKENSLRTYTMYYNKHISPEIGKTKVQKIERRQAQSIQKKLQEVLSTTSANMAFKVLNLVLNAAVRDEIITRNPASGIEALKNDSKAASKTYHRALTEDEQKAFMECLKDDFYYTFIALMLCTGMRQGETAALTWNDIDYKNNVIHINKTVTFTKDNKQIIGKTPKTKASIRDIPMTATIKSILKKQRLKLESIGLTPVVTRLVFMTSINTIVSDQMINIAISKAAKAAGLEHFTSHGLRDTFATRFIEQGGQPQTLKTILGHESLAMTMDLYSHVLPNTKQKEMDNLVINI